MNKKDWLLIIIVIILSLLFIFSSKISADVAYVYYESDLILTIDLNINKIYEVNGYNGIVKIEVNNKSIRVVEENSDKHICSRQGYIKNEGESIVCLPNKIVIELKSNDIDVEVK